MKIQRVESDAISRGNYKQAMHGVWVNEESRCVIFYDTEGYAWQVEVNREFDAGHSKLHR